MINKNISILVLILICISSFTMEQTSELKQEEQNNLIHPVVPINLKVLDKDIIIYMFNNEVDSILATTERLEEAIKQISLRLIKPFAYINQKINDYKDYKDIYEYEEELCNVFTIKLLTSKFYGNFINNLKEAQDIKQALNIYKNYLENIKCSNNTINNIIKIYFCKHFKKFILNSEIFKNLQNKSQREKNILLLSPSEIQQTNIDLQDLRIYFLIKAGADINFKNKQNKTILNREVCYNNIQIIKLLIKRGASINHIDNQGKTILHFILRVEYSNEISKLLIASGANINAKDIHGSTPLMYAAYYKNLEMVKFLISKGADVNIINYFGNTALNITDSIKIHDLLIEAGAKIEMPKLDYY